MNKIPWTNIVDYLKKGAPEETADDLLNDWIKQPENQQVYADAESIWSNVQYKASEYNPDKDSGWRKVSGRIQKQVRTVTIPLWNLYRYSAAVIILLVAGFGLYSYVDKYQQDSQVIFKYATLSGKSTLTLPDGTKVWLGPRTEITYANDFTSENRNVTVLGKAYFEVKKDSLHPFTVNVDKSKIKVYGTSFNVNNTEKNLTVSLLSGKITFWVDEGAKPQPVLPGEAVTLNKHTGMSAICKSDVFFDVIWAQEKLRIEEKNLGDVVKYLNQWYDAEISLDPALKDRYRYTLTITNEQLDEILRMLSRINPMEITYDKNKVTIK